MKSLALKLNACNYDALATVDDGSCCYDPNGGACTNIEIEEGLTDDEDKKDLFKCPKCGFELEGNNGKT